VVICTAVAVAVIMVGVICITAAVIVSLCILVKYAGMVMLTASPSASQKSNIWFADADGNIIHSLLYQTEILNIIQPTR